MLHKLRYFSYEVPCIAEFYFIDPMSTFYVKDALKFEMSTAVL
jgi:hypothetical protein